ncbi:uncharacterized protein LY89DRAFT_677091 [Mollisia scopiformis]|uniref:V-SNARE coiled-coil homology domain-containing protein n=1 Tax=Mollisia scopiformis TaxID=149040 RepID=A0A132B716_MOLSC|nr:uncharacterized protein LY89DRAFT_677091 [Mollisia scopiformis]KUJ08200.1 hypothetical protein LY89DRAFT_677091 [Mollisia scopiformis]
MAEAIAALGVIASVAQLADYGFKLSIKLYSFSETVYTADRSIKSISNDVSLTSTVLKELCQIIESDDAHVVSENAILATKQTVDECLKIFGDLDEALNKSLSNMGKLEKGESEKQKKVNRGTMTFERLKWPFKQSKMELLRSNLDRLKASLTLMLQVLSYARDVSSRKQAQSSLEYQRQMIESLARSERAMKRKYYALQHALEEQNRHEPVIPAINASVNITGSRDVNEEPPDYNSAPVRSSNPVGELLLCFKLLHSLLESSVPSGGVSSMKHEIVTQAQMAIQDLGVNKIQKQYGAQSLDVKVEALKTLQMRLKNLVKVDHLNGFVSEEIVDQEENFDAMGNKIVSSKKAKKLTSAELRKKKKERMSRRKRGDEVFSDEEDENDEAGQHVKYTMRERVLESEDTVRGTLKPVESSGLAGERPSDLRVRTSSREREKLPRYDDRYEERRTSHSIYSSSDSLPLLSNHEKEKLPAYDEGGAASLPPTTLHPKTSDIMQAQMHETVAIMRQHVAKVSERGERLDSLQDHTDSLQMSAQAFRRAANRQRPGPWTRAYRGVAQSIASAGTASYKSIQNLSESIYEAGSVLFAEPEEDEAEQSDIYLPAAVELSESDEELEKDGKIIDDLLSQWTTLPARGRGSPIGDNASS